jgi:hypothetical protein
VPAPRWFVRFAYDVESAAWGRQGDEPGHGDRVGRTVDRLADVVPPPVLAMHVLQHLSQPAAFVAEIRRCLGSGGHPLITAPVRDTRSLASQNLYWRLRAGFYQRVPGIVRFYDTESLPRLVEDQGLRVIECDGEPTRVSVLARA